CLLLPCSLERGFGVSPIMMTRPRSRGSRSRRRVYACDETCSSSFMREPAEAACERVDLGTIPRVVDGAANRFAGVTAVDDEGTKLTFAELDAAVTRAARALMALGVARGDRIALWAPNTWEWVVAALGVHAAGAVLVPINTRFKGREAAQVIARS